MNNLAFGDATDDGDIDDLVVTDNKDTAMVLATIAWTIKKFFDVYPGERIYFKGSTEIRTRLYQLAISRNLDSLREEFNIPGL